MNKLGFILAMGIFLAGTQTGFAKDEKAVKAPDLSPEKMAEMEKFSTPGEGHRKLDPLAGKFKAKTTWKMNAGAPAQISEGTTETKWILDGRFIQQTFKGEMMGKPFEGINIIGYDNFTKQYNSIWIDSMATGMVKATAEYDDASKTFREKGSFSCPVTGKKNESYKATTQMIDADHYTYEMWHEDENGKEFKAMEIQYERT